ncbi:tetratricopeptide repeat protein [Nocardioides sambongensis]|uniref:tetratricopeptide repeat protein n=1 Tax=Nocardioides sambongensis TaxID=2589074 RepID=UPI0018C898B7|nr:hypothetical protein [Nocardioides sambongensis]
MERDLDTAWELFAAQPTHPEIAVLAARVIAAQPERSSAALLLGNHRELCGDTDEARRLYLDVAGRRDGQFVNAARSLRHLASVDHDRGEALHWAQVVLREEQEDWRDWMELGAAQATAGQHEAGWQHLDDAVARCARTTPDELPRALGMRAVSLLETFAPADRFIAAAEEAIRADAANTSVALMLGWSYLLQYRFTDAEELGLRLLRDDPTDELLHNLVQTTRSLTKAIESGEADGYTLDDIRRSGVIEMSWQQIRDRTIGIDLASALAALEAAVPADLRASLRPAASVTDLADRERLGPVVAEDLVSWHDGQRPGSGHLWGLDEGFRLMTAAEMIAFDAAVEEDPAGHPDWPENELWEPVMTDDQGAYLVVVGHGALVKRRPGHPDEPVAASMADWIWDRVAGFGGRDPRPAPAQLDGAAEVERPADNDPETVAEIDRLSQAVRSAPEGDSTAEVALWQQVAGLRTWFFIARGPDDEPRPFALALDQGPVICLYSSAARAREAARLLDAAGVEGGPVPLLGVPMPEAVDYVASFGRSGVFGVALDHPHAGHYIPLANLGMVKGWADGSAR